MSGLLVGILISRTLSGLIAALGGWRLTFVFAAALMLVLAVALRRGLPVVAPTERLRYRALLRSVLALVAAEPILRRRMLFGAFAMAGFSVLWTSIAFLLAGPPYGYGEGVIGLFGLAGLAGALIAPVAGRLADRGHTRLALGGALSATLASWILLDLGRSSLAALIAGIVLLDLGIQATHINNQSAVYRLHPEARSRLTTAYMVAYFTGGVLGSTLASTVYASSGWTATCLLGAAPALAGTGGLVGDAGPQPRQRDRPDHHEPLAAGGLEQAGQQLEARDQGGLLLRGGALERGGQRRQAQRRELVAQPGADRPGDLDAREAAVARHGRPAHEAVALETVDDAGDRAVSEAELAAQLGDGQAGPGPGGCDQRLHRPRLRWRERVRACPQGLLLGARDRFQEGGHPGGAHRRGQGSRPGIR